MVFVFRMRPFQSVCHTPDAIVALAFGQRDEDDDDPVNKALAEEVWNTFGRLPKGSVNVFLQWEIYDTFPGPFKTINAYRIKEHRQKQPNGRPEYLDTREVLLQAKDAGAKKVYIVAHPDHAWRVMMCARNMGLAIAGVADTTRIGYDSLSTQKWTRTRLRWWFYEMCMGRPGYWLIKHWI